LIYLWVKDNISATSFPKYQEKKILDVSRKDYTERRREEEEKNDKVNVVK